MNYASLSKSDNTTIATAIEIVAKWNRMGFGFGPLHINENVAGGQQASYVPITELDVEGNVPYCLLVSDGANWHNVAALIRTWGAGDITGFQRLADMNYSHRNWTDKLLSVPGVTKAVNAALAKA